MKRPRIYGIAAGAVFSAAAGNALAASPQCVDDDEVNCFRGEVFVMKGEDFVDVTSCDSPGKPIGTDAMAGQLPIDKCSTFKLKMGSNPEQIVQKALELSKVTHSGNIPFEVVLFTGDFSIKDWNPLFVRTMGKDADGKDVPVNAVTGIGLPGVAMPPMGKPYTGYVVFGNTSSMNNDNPRANKVGGGGSAFNDFYTPFDFLAQAAGNVYGPYLLGTNATYPLAMSKDDKPPVVNMDAGAPAAGDAGAGDGGAAPPVVMATGPKVPVSKPHWSAYLDLKNSLFGGNNWRNEGNGTVQSAPDPQPYYGILPFLATAQYNGARMLRFSPIDLYLMGLMSKAELMATETREYPGKIPFYYVGGGRIIKGDQDVKDATNFGTRIAGRKKDIIIDPVNPLTNKNETKKLGFADFVPAGMERAPAFGDAPKHIRQLWVVLSRPNKAAKDSGNKLEVQRRLFGSHYYMQTEHRGRIITRADGVDDTGHFEFVNTEGAADKRVAGAGVPMGFEQIAPQNLGAWVVTEGTTDTDPARITYLRTEGDGSFRVDKFAGQSFGISRSVANMVVVRMRSVDSANGRLEISINGEEFTQFPGGNSSILADGQWHLYAAKLPDGDADITSFELRPNTEGGQNEIDSIRFVLSSKDKDADKDCFIPIVTPEGKKKAKPDGVIDEVDNCPDLYNPDQLDTDGNGRGDACEDSDGDSVADACDNCLLVANLDQNDANGNKIGDRCDKGRDERAACFLAPYSIGGASSSGTSRGFGVLALLGAVGIVAGRLARRRRSRGKHQDTN